VHGLALVARDPATTRRFPLRPFDDGGEIERVRSPSGTAGWSNPFADWPSSCSRPRCELGRSAMWSA
jgi:hypothetical protein